MRTRTLLALPLAATLLAAGLTTVVVPDGATAGEPAAGPLVFGHRGASGYRPEHTLAAYDLAIRLGADVIEPDLVSTKDGVLVARHENEIGGTTDVEARFPGLKRTKTIDGTQITGWFTEDLTLAQLRTLRAEERLPAVRQENTVHDGRYLVPTLDEVLALVKDARKRYSRTVAVAPETKHPTYFDSIGLSLEEKVLADLREAGLDKAKSPVYVQSFEVENLKDLRRLGAEVALVQLTGGRGGPADRSGLTYAQMTTSEGLRKVAAYADVLGPEKNQVVRRGGSAAADVVTPLVRDAHAAGLRVVPYTVRAENQFLPVQHRRTAPGTTYDPNAYGDVVAELRELFAAGIDGVFTDQPDLGVLARDGA